MSILKDLLRVLAGLAAILLVLGAGGLLSDANPINWLTLSAVPIAAIVTLGTRVPPQLRSVWIAWVGVLIGLVGLRNVPLGTWHKLLGPIGVLAVSSGLLNALIGLVGVLFVPLLASIRGVGLTKPPIIAVFVVSLAALVIGMAIPLAYVLITLRGDLGLLQLVQPLAPLALFLVSLFSGFLVVAVSFYVMVAWRSQNQPGLWLAGRVAALGVLVGGVEANIRQANPLLLSRWLEHPAANGLVLAVVVGTMVSGWLWAQQSGMRERRAFAAAITATSGLMSVFSALASRLGWWGGVRFQGPIPAVALMIGFESAFDFAVSMVLYRWLAAKRRWLALLLYCLIAVAIIPVTLIMDRDSLNSGVLVFNRGYTVWHDLAVNELSYWLLLVVYQVLRRRMGSPEVRRPSAAKDAGV